MGSITIRCVWCGCIVDFIQSDNIYDDHNSNTNICNDCNKFWNRIIKHNRRKHGKEKKINKF